MTDATTAVPPAETENEPEESDWLMPPEQARAFFDARARELLGLSGEEFLRRLDAGEYEDIEETLDTRPIVHLALLAPFGRR